MYNSETDFSKALHPRYTKCKHPASGPATSVLVAGVQQRNVALVTHTASGPSGRNKMIKSVFIPFFVWFCFFSFACHGQGPMETHGLLHNSYCFPQNPIFHLKTTPQKGFSPFLWQGIFFCQADFAIQWFIFKTSSSDTAQLRVSL